MKRLVLLLLSAMMTMMMMAGNVTTEQARQLATQFMTNHLTKVGPAHRANKPIQLSMPIEVEGLHLFNLEDGNGFVIVSNDDRTDAILGYSDEATLNPENMPDNMRAWLHGYADQIKWMDEHGITAKASRRAGVKTDIAPLMVTKWNQGTPYNNLVNTTDYFTYTGAVTGCVATAMAQVMYYTSIKAGVNSSVTLKATDEYTTSYGKTIPVVPAGTVLNWNKMLPEYTAGSYTDEEATAVATLMRACGASVQMDYANSASGGSSAFAGDVPAALITYFGYKNTTQYVDRSSYTYANWIDMLYHELSVGRPVFYSGQSTGGGHAFVCDGYEYEDYFHINWGWGGKSDGYFKLSALDPDEQGIGGSSSTDGYHIGQGAIVGIQLESGTGTIESNPSTIDLTLNSVTASKTSMTTDETIKITFNITNNSASDYDGEIGIYVIDYKLLNGEMFLIPAGGTKDCVVEFSPNFTGTADITAYKPNGTGGYSTINYTKKTTVTITAGSTPPPPSSSTSDLNLTASIKSIENSNAGKTEVYGNAINNNIKAVITISNPSTDYNFKGYFRIYLRSDYSWNSNTAYITIPANGSYDFEFNASDLVLNRTYHFTTCYVRTGSDFTAEVNVGGNFNFLPGVFAYSADGTKSVTKATGTYVVPEGVLSVDLSGSGITTVNKNSNPNCLYILKNTDAVPAGLTNVIQFNGTSYTAANITLTDGYDFESPVDFTATNIEFTYNNDRSADGSNGWNTIILPFDVTQVTANGTPINWFTSSSEKGKNFWLKEFSSDGASSVGFNYTSSMKANTPYIIALPGSKWGDTYNLSGKTIKFIGNNVEVKKSAQSVVTGSFYRFIGNTKAVNTANIYCINAAGNRFELKLSGGSAAFRPFFKPDIFDRSVGSLTIGNGGGTTGIELPELPQEIQSDKIFDLNGRQITKPTKGIVIKNGRKVVTK